MLRRVIIAECVDKLAHLQPAHVRDQMSQQGIRADVERDAEESIRRALIKLAMEQRGGNLPVSEGSRLLNLELKQRMTRREVDIIAFARIPAADNQTPRILITF